jgi:F-type H+-transporting ATPase subunit a
LRQISGKDMLLKCVRPLLVAVYSLFAIVLALPLQAQEKEVPQPAKKGFDAKEIIFGHVLNNHDFHLLDWVSDDGTKHPISLPLPVILYSAPHGWDIFMSSKFHHGEESHRGYIMLTTESIERFGLDPMKYNPQDILALDSTGKPDTSEKVYDLSITRNVLQMLVALGLFIWIMISIATKYKNGQGVVSAPKGSQGLLEPVIVFIRDEVAIPNLGHNYKKFLPFLLTIFFFILINNLFGLIPGSANVSGNIAFTGVLGVISFVVILFNSNAHYWKHIFNPPGVPGGVKPVLVLVEFISVFIKPFALIIRLFANMVAGHIIIICLISLIFVFSNMSTYAGWGTAPFSVAFTIFIYFIEILVAFIQAFIFTMLTAVFVGQAMEGSDHGVEGHEDAVIA